MIIGRDAEILAMERLVGGARIARSGVLVVTGEAGIGKTSLLDHVAGTAESVRVLRSRGSESEQDLPFSGLHALLRPVLGLVEAIPAPQADALGVALALREGTAADRFAVSAATLSLLSRCAEDQPLLLVVDDAQWLDRPSAEALVFACRRLMADPVAVLVATRPAPGSPLHDAPLPQLPLRGLTVEHVAQLLRARTGASVPGDLADRIRRATGGNPLAVAELAASLDSVASLAPPSPVQVSDRVLGEFARRVSGLAADARTALLVASISEGDVTVADRALAGMGIHVGVLDEAERVGLVRLSAGHLEFRHPLARASAYACAPADERRRAHRAVALVQPASAPDRRAWHLSEATIGPDDDLAVAMTEVAERAENRGAHSVAATAFERAASLSSQEARRAVLLRGAGEAASLAGQVVRALGLLDRAATSAPDLRLRAEVEGTRGQLEMRTGSLRKARVLLRRAVAGLASADPDTAAIFAADLVQTCFLLGATTDASEAATLLEELLPGTTTPYADVRGRVWIGVARVLAGQPGIELIRSALEELAAGTWWRDDLRHPSWIVAGVLFLRESSTAHEFLETVVQEIRDRCALGMLPDLLFHTARDDATTDRWAAARAGYDEGIDLARECGLSTDRAMLLAGRAWLRARTGDSDGARADAAEASALAAENRVHLARAWSLFALGDLDLGRGLPEQALAHHAGLDSYLERIGLLDVDLSPGPEMVEALVRCGRRPEAVARADDYHRRAIAKGQPWAIARAERALAAVTPGEAAAVHFERALVLHRDSPDAFEDARSRLAYGAWLRRSRRRVAARTLLREALATFDRLGAEPWVQQAALELEATGEHPHRRGDRSIDLLTPQEVRIAAMLGSGRTTREAAAALFLSPKTVEYHLRHIYTKLGVHSRDELSRSLDQ
ncbi:AAA family ATPase [Nocardioides sp. JQ2195]|uniref:ATP-binding protein n=1 Tax=Nocardioides sp. JQ2195 TaxID=2592334 RepID=UPI00143E93B1|nr:LuxR family transcriptional regulator [Nocardioides sp. JQ2195]QIX26166.1 AAA family ATPase [Nocardioides sp. JQ2195]